MKLLVKSGLRAACVFTAAVVCPANGSAAGYWEFHPLFSTAGEYNDNRHLLLEKQEIYGNTATLAADVSRTSPTAVLRISPKLSYLAYNDKRLDGADAAVDFNLQTEHEGYAWALQGGYREDKALTTEWEGVVFDYLVLQETSKRRHSWNTAPSFTLNAGSASFWQLDLGHSNVQYDGATRTSLIDYANTDASVNFVVKPREKNLWRVGVFGDYLDAPDARYRTTSYGAQMSLERELSELSQLEFSGGGRVNVTPASGSGAEQKETWQMSLLFKRRIARGNWNMKLERAYSPSAQGRLLRRNLAGYGIGYSLTSDVSLNFNVQASSNAELDGDRRIREWNYGYTALQWSWNISRQVTLSAGHRYGIIVYTDIDETAVNNGANLTLHYRTF